MKFDVTNNAPGPRTFQCAPLIEGDEPAAVTLTPGATETLDLIDRNHPVLKAWADAKEVTFAPAESPKPMTKG